MTKKEIEHTSTMLGNQDMKGSQRMVSVVEPYELPNGWKWCRLGDVAAFIGGGTPDKSNISYWNGKIPWASVKDIKGDFLFDTEDFITELGLHESSANMCDKNGLILVTRISPGKAIISKIETAINQDLKIVETKEYKPFLKFFFDFYEDEIKLLSSGTTVKGIKLEVLNKLPFPLPPTLAEQQRIVNRIESMFAKLDEAKEKASNVLDGFELRKAAILHKAFTGKLTAKWRKENDVSDDSWEEKTLGECGSVYGGGTPSTSHKEYWENGNILWITSKDMKYDVIEDSEMHVNVKGIENSSAKLIDKPSLLFVMRSGILRRTFPICMVKKEFTVNQDLKALVPHDFVLLEYLFYACQSNERKILNTCMKNGTTVESINAKALLDFKILVPTLPEQQEIVRILDNVLEKERIAKQAAEKVLEQIDLLKKTILARAFRGEL